MTEAREHWFAGFSCGCFVHQPVTDSFVSPVMAGEFRVRYLSNLLRTPTSASYLLPTERFSRMKSLISSFNGPVKPNSFTVDHLLEIERTLCETFQVNLEVNRSGVRIKMADDVRDNRERGLLLQEHACHGMAKAVHSPAFLQSGHVGLLHICQDQLF